MINVHKILLKNIYEAIRHNYVSGKEGDKTAKTMASWYLISYTDAKKGMIKAIEEIVDNVVDQCERQVFTGYNIKPKTPIAMKSDILSVKKSVKYEV